MHGHHRGFRKRSTVFSMFSERQIHDHSYIEVLSHYDIAKEAKNTRWLIHGAEFRCYFGHNDSGFMVNPATGERVPALGQPVHEDIDNVCRHHKPLFDNYLQNGIMKDLNFS